jgi:hypothetical protein
LVLCRGKPIALKSTLANCSWIPQKLGITVDPACGRHPVNLESTLRIIHAFHVGTEKNVLPASDVKCRRGGKSSNLPPSSAISNCSVLSSWEDAKESIQQILRHRPNGRSVKYADTTINLGLINVTVCQMWHCLQRDSDTTLELAGIYMVLKRNGQLLRVSNWRKRWLTVDRALFIKTVAHLF